jgi:hypothetical protein
MPLLAGEEKNDEVKALQALKAEVELYRQKLQELEERLQQAEAKLQDNAQKVAIVEQKAAQANQQSKVALSRPNIMNPQLSVILDGQYADFSRNYRETIPGFQPSGNHVRASDKGFSLNHAEMTASANIDPYFYGQMTVAYEDENVELEEAFFETLSLPYGLTLKGGRFLSALGYQNSKHPHAWDFVDDTLPYRAMLGTGNWGSEGAALRWLAPLPFMLSFYAEAFRGDEFPGNNDSSANGANAKAFGAKWGMDINPSNSVAAGIGQMRSSADMRQSKEHEHDDDHDHSDPLAFSGDSHVTVLDWVWKWAPNGDVSSRSFKLYGEYFWGHENGNYFLDRDITIPYDGGMRGWYLAGVYQFLPRWRYGMRYDMAKRGATPDALEETELFDHGHTPWRLASMLDFSPSEMSRIRLQYNYDKVEEAVNHLWYFQYIMSLGAHGAHGF